MPLAFLLLFALLVLASVYYFGQHWAPVLAASSLFDSRLKLVLLVLGVLFVLTQLALGISLWRARRRGSPATGKPQRDWEWIWAGTAAIIFFGLNFAGALIFPVGSVLGPSTQKDAVRVEVTAEQFRWNFRYPGPDGRYGATRPALRDAAEGNPLGLDRSDAAAADDIVTATLAIPADRDVEITLRSHDVIHSFFVPSLRFKQDAMPGMDILLHIRAERPGDYDLVCAELCGIGHNSMNAKLRVLPPAEFDRWLAGARQR